MTKSKSKSKFDGDDRRKDKRRPILETFLLFLSIPKKGGYRLPLYDLSESGMSFDFDTEGEDPTAFPIAQGEEVELHLYLNQSLFLPLKVRIMRIIKSGSIRKVGGEFVDDSSRAYAGLRAFLRMLDELSEGEGFGKRE